MNSLVRLKLFVNFNFLCLSFVSLFAIGFGNTIVQSYYQYYASDMIPLPLTMAGYVVQNAESASAIFLFFVLLGSSVAAWPAGRLADKYSRKWLACFALFLQASASVGICVKTSFEWDMLFAFVYGVGYASYSAISFAILTDILGTIGLEEGEYALGTGLYYFVQFLPTSFTPLLYGFIIDYYHKQHHAIMGYWLLYGQCAAGLVVGMFMILLLRPMKVQHESIQ